MAALDRNRLVSATTPKLLFNIELLPFASPACVFEVVAGLRRTGSLEKPATFLSCRKLADDKDTARVIRTRGLTGSLILHDAPQCALTSRTRTHVCILGSRR